MWTLHASTDLGATARDRIGRASPVYVPPGSFQEIRVKHRAGTWPLPDSDVQALPQRLARQGGMLAPYTAAMAMFAGGRDRDHRDLFDRVIAATAMDLGCPLISGDAAFDGSDDRPGWPGRLWQGRKSPLGLIGRPETCR